MSASVWTPSGFLNAVSSAFISFIQNLTGAATRDVQSKLRDVVSVKDFDTTATIGTATVDATAAFELAIAALPGYGGVVQIPRGTYLLSRTLTLTAGIKFVGEGYSEGGDVGVGNRGATCLLRASTFIDPNTPLILLSGVCSGIDNLDVDGNDIGTTCDNIVIWGSRAKIGEVSSRNASGDGVRIGKTDPGASSINANFWRIERLITTHNNGNGLRIDHTNTDIDMSYPLGRTDANAGVCDQLDAKFNTIDGLQIGNANDNVFAVVGSQHNGGCGIRFKTDGVNSGPRCNHILSNDCEVNTGNDIQIDAATLPVSGPGLYNIVLGNRSVAVSSRIVDNSTGSLVVQWTTNVPFRGYQFGPDLNVLNLAGQCGYNFATGANAAPARIYAVASGATDSNLFGQVKKSGGVLTSGWQINEFAVFQPLNEHIVLAYSAAIAVDAKTGHLFDITATNGTAFTIGAPSNSVTGQTITFTIRNTSGGALGVITWNAIFKMAAWVSPATANSRSITFKYNGTNWVETTRTAADIPN